MVNANISIFEVNDVDASEDACRVFVTDLLNAGSYELINRGLATTASQGVILGIRLIEIANGVHMTSGASFAFDAAHKNKLLNDYSHQKFKARRKNSPPKSFFFSCTLKVQFTEAYPFTCKGTFPTVPQNKLTPAISDSCN